LPDPDKILEKRRKSDAVRRIAGRRYIASKGTGLQGTAQVHLPSLLVADKDAVDTGMRGEESAKPQ
jgi:hypothetical protein